MFQPDTVQVSHPRRHNDVGSTTLPPYVKSPAAGGAITNHESRMKMVPVRGYAKECSPENVEFSGTAA